LPVSPPFSSGDLKEKIKASAQVIHHVELFEKIIIWGVLSIQEGNVKVFLGLRGGGNDLFGRHLQPGFI